MDIKQSPSGIIVNMSTGYQAFVPHALPPPFEWDNVLVNNLSRADYILGKLAREGSRLPNPHLMMRPFIAREAVLSSKIEGTRATLGEILADEAGALVDRSSDELQEVHNYVVALNYGLERLSNFPLSLRLIREIHEKLMQGVRGSHATPGEFRHTQNWIGIPGCTLATAKYVPPPPDELVKVLGAFEIFLHDKTLPPLVHVALCHYQFEAIHPFLDGNGRVGRLLIALLLVERGMLPTPILYLSAFFEATRDEYYRQLYNVSAQGTWHDWLAYFLNGVATQSDDVLSRAERINEVVNGWLLSVSGSSTPTLQNIVRHFAINPFLTVKKIAETADVAFTTAQKSVGKLEDLGIIKQTNDRQRDRVYCATKILAILEEPANIQGFM